MFKRLTVIALVMYKVKQTPVCVHYSVSLLEKKFRNDSQTIAPALALSSPNSKATFETAWVTLSIDIGSL